MSRLIAVEGIDGAGKSTLVRNVTVALEEQGHRVFRTRLSGEMGAVFRRWKDAGPEGPERYQDVLPGAFRRAAYIVDAVAQFRYHAELYATYDYLVFDRWLPTYDAYCSGTGRNEEWYRRLAGMLPVPDVMFHLRVPPAVALARLRTRGDWTVDHWSGDRLLADLTRLHGTYATLMTAPDVVPLDGEKDAAGLLAEALRALHVAAEVPA